MSSGTLPLSQAAPSTEEKSSSPDTGPTSSLQNDCLKYHSLLDTIHAKIYRYNTFSELLQYLKTTLEINTPHIDYPSKEILLMIITGTQLHHIDEKLSDRPINLSVPCIEYMNQLLRLFESPLTFDDDDKQKLYDEELANLYERLKTLFSFLKPAMDFKRSKRKRNNMNSSPSVLSIDDSMLDYSIEENMSALDTELRNDKTQSLFEISTTSDKFNTAETFFGIKYLPEAEKNLWKYFLFAFKTASKLTEIERVDSYESYNETWTRWREFLNIVIRFMRLELERSPDITDSLFALNMMSISGCMDTSEMEQSQYLDSLLTFSEYVFTNSRSSFHIPSIIPLDLTLSQKHNFSSNPSMLEYKYQGSGICLDSLPTRSRLLRICWKYLLRLPIETTVKDQFCNKIAKELLTLKPKELNYFFYDALPSLNNKNVGEDILFVVSFHVISLMSRTWTMTYENVFKNFEVYLKQLKNLFDSVPNGHASSTKTGLKNERSDGNYPQEALNDDVEKCFVLAKYQLQIVLSSMQLTDKEWDLLDAITCSVNGKSVCLRKAVKKQHNQI